MTGILDGRFSEDRILLTDMRSNLSSECSVAILGTVNDEQFSITRTYDGKKTKLKFIVNGSEKKASTLKKKQKDICASLFNASVGDKTCPQRFLHKLLLQRIVWKQGGRDSDLLKMNFEAFQAVCLETMNKGDYCAFTKYLKTKISSQKKKLEQHKNNLMKLGVVLNERKEISRTENFMLNAWCDHRRKTLEECKDKLKELQSVNVSRGNVDDFINHNVSVQVLQSRVKDLIESKVGTRWNPEFTLNKLEEASEDVNRSNNLLKSYQSEIENYVRCLETFKYILKIFYKRICKVLEGFDCDVNLMGSKKVMLDGQPMKYLSGGEYEQESLKVFTAFKRFVSSYGYWKCNLSIYDEPGTAMSTQSLQNFIDKNLSPDRANLVIHTKL